MNESTQPQPLDQIQIPEEQMAAEPQVLHEVPPAHYPPQAPTYPAPVFEKPKKIKKGVPGITGFGFTAALLSLFLAPMYKNAFSSYLLYEGLREALLHYYYYSSIVLGGAGAFFALLGAILSPIGAFLSRKRESDGRALGVAGVLIAFVALILIAAITVSHLMLHGQLYPST